MISERLLFFFLKRTISNKEKFQIQLKESFIYKLTYFKIETNSKTSDFAKVSSTIMNSDDLHNDSLNI